MNETVMEMHFHSATIDLVRGALGIGSGSSNFYKYSPQRECFVGFDQAYVRTDLGEDELFAQLKADATNNRYSLTNFFLGLFLQYKVVRKISNTSRRTPSSITSRPYMRASIDTKKNDRTGFSQHELLYRLSRNAGTFVYYACPMLFEREKLYVQPADLSLLRLVDLLSSPSEYTDNESHYIFFNDEDSTPLWCSDPVGGKAVSMSELLGTIRHRIEEGDLLESQIALLDLLMGHRSGVSDGSLQNVIAGLQTCRSNPCGRWRRLRPARPRSLREEAVKGRPAMATLVPHS